MKHNFKSNRKAFTLVELLIVIAIIGILFVVLVSKVDFATDKANTTGVQTDFRSFQVAFETVSRENSGFNTLGWDTGDKVDASLIAGYTYENADKDGGDRVRNSYDKGDLNLNGICEDGETWTGQKLYTETWTGIYTLDNPADATDMSAYIDLEKAINANLDPALRVSIDPENKTIYMANGYQDPWKTEYHGFYLSNADVDGKDRGAIVMYSDGPNKVFGSEQTIANGIVTVTVKNGGINGQDDLSIVTCYTYTNGYGEIGTTTFGFSNNQQMQVGGGNGGLSVVPAVGEGGYQTLSGAGSTYDIGNAGNTIELRVDGDFNKFTGVKVDGVDVDGSNYTKRSGSTIVTFNQSYLNTLSVGEHKVEFIFTDGTAISNFYITYDGCEHPEHDINEQCLVCGETTTHNLNEERINSGNNDGTHIYHEWCTQCGYDNNLTESCSFSGNVCGWCGSLKPSSSCDHSRTSITYTRHDCTSCIERLLCDDCGVTVSTQYVEHTPGDANFATCYNCRDRVHKYVNSICSECGNSCYHDLGGDCICDICGYITEPSDDYYHDYDESGYCPTCGTQKKCEYHDEWSFLNGICEICGYACKHIDKYYTNHTWGDCYNCKVVAICNICGMVNENDYGFVAHTPMSGGNTCEACCMEMHNYVDGICTTCSANENCSHTNTQLIGYCNDNPNRTHTWNLKCSDCNAIIKDTVDCVPCGYTEYKDNGDGTHVAMNLCGDCSNVAYEVIEDCSNATCGWTHQYSN